MKQILLSLLCAVSIFASAPTVAQPTPSDYYMMGFGLVGSSVSAHLSKHYFKQHKTSIALDIVSKVLLGLFYKETAEVVYSTLTDKLPIKPSRTKAPLELEKCKKQLEDYRIATTPIEVTQQVERINTLKQEQGEFLLIDALRRIDENSRTWFTQNSKENAKILLSLTEKFIQLYPGLLNEDRNFFSTPDSAPKPTGETNLYDAERLRNLAKPFKLKSKIDSMTTDLITQHLNTLLSSGQKPKVLYTLTLFDVMGLQIPMPDEELGHESSNEL